MSKNLMILLVLCLALALSAPALAQYSQLVTNADFESWGVNGPGGPPDNWRIVNSPTLTAPREGTIVHGGASSTKLTWTAATGTQNLSADTISVMAESTYTISVWVFDNDATGRGRLWLSWNSTSTGEGPSTYSSDVGSWVQYSYGPVVAPRGATKMVFQYRCYTVSGSAAKTLYIDDVEVRGPVMVGNLLPPTIAPLYRTPATVSPVDAAKINAYINDLNGTVATDSLYYRLNGGAYTPVFHDSIQYGNKYWYTIGANPYNTLVEYHIAAVDNLGLRRETSPDSAYSVGYLIIPLTPIAGMQFNTTNQGTAPDCYPSPRLGLKTKITGIVSGRYQATTTPNRFWMQDADSVWSGVLVFSGTPVFPGPNPGPPVVGDSVTVIGTPAEYNGLTELAAPFDSLYIHSSGNTVHAPIVMTAATLGSGGCLASSEKYEGMFCEVSNVLITSYLGSPVYVCWGSDGSGDSIGVSNNLYRNGTDTLHITIGMTYSTIRGIVGYSGGKYYIMPRFPADVVVAPINAPPVISNVAHVPGPGVLPTDDVSVNATITDADGTVAADSLYLQINGGGFNPIAHTSVNGNIYSYHIGTRLLGTFVEYYVIAKDDDAARTQSATYSYTVSLQTECTATTTIFDVQNSFDPGDPDTTLCWPSPDTTQFVNVCGIVTAVQQGASRRFYLQDPINLAFGGIYCYPFKIGPDTIRVALGNHIQINARVKEYYGWTEFDSVQNYVVLASGNSFDTSVVTVGTFAPGCDYTTEPYESGLVKINNITVLSANGSYQCWIKDNLSSDSIRIDNGLYSSGSDQPSPLPSTGATYQWIVGVMKWEGRNNLPPSSTKRGWILQGRFASDFEIFIPPQPVAVDVWSVNSTTAAVKFDRPMALPNTGNFSTYNGLSITGVALNPTNTVAFLTTAVQPNNTMDTMFVNGVCGLDGYCMTTPNHKKFRPGFTNISIVRTLGIGDTMSAIIGDIVTVKAVVVADTSNCYATNTNFINDRSGPPSNGVELYIPVPFVPYPQRGDTIIVTGKVDEYYAQTELTLVADYNNVVILSLGSNPVPATVTAADLLGNNEGFEGVLVTLCDSFVVTNIAYDAYGFLVQSITTPTESIIIHKQTNHTRYSYVPVLGDRIRGITGIYRYQRGAYRLMPRYDADFNTSATWCATGPDCHYVVGDANYSNSFNGLDVTYSVNYFKGGAAPPYSCECTPGNTWFVAGDVNHSCSFNGLDVTFMVNYFKGGAAPVPCADCPPAVLSAPNNGDTPAVQPILNTKTRIQKAESSE